jgi:hypothetical protein
MPDDSARFGETAAEELRRVPLPWIAVAPGAPYFVDETGAPWTPIGQNDAVSWPELGGLFRRRDVAGVERHLRWLASQGVTCLRLMMECAHARHRYLERPAGRFVPLMVQFWDDLFALCERVGIRILLTPVDTFWTWLRWAHHPWNRRHGGPLDRPSRLLLCADTRDAIKMRLEFAVRRWGGSGALFGWDLWNEIHPAQALESADVFDAFIADLSGHVRRLETALYGRSHPQTVSLFGPELYRRPRMPLAAPIFRHPDLDFASIHVYSTGSIDDPKDTVAPAVAMGRIVRDALAEIADTRPFLDTEHGPIHAFKDRKRTLPADFDDEYFRHIAWAHLASGGAGGGMRWPNRHPHVLTPGMREAQRAMAGFLPLIDWARFRRRNLNDEATADGAHVFACASETQAVVWTLRKDGVGRDGRMRSDGDRPGPEIALPGLATGVYRITGWDTRRGVPAGRWTARAADGFLRIPSATFGADMAFAVSSL